jgi:protein bicaudal D
MENERLTAEKTQIEKDFDEFLQNKEISAVEFKELRAELREVKRRETRLLQDYADLEEENITLQKQVSNLRSAQVSHLSLI